MKFNNIILIPIIYILVSCNIISLSDENVSCSIDGNTSVFNGEYISYIFSNSCNNKEAEECISILENTSSRSIEFKWENNILKVKPENGWKKGRFYQVIFEGNLIINSQNISPFILRNFYYGDPNLIPRLIEESIIYPEKVDSSLDIKFSRSINPIFILDKISVYPSTKISAEFNEDNTGLIIKPLEEWKPNTLYKIYFKNFESVDAYSMEDKEISFGVFQDDEYPKLKEIRRLIHSEDSYISPATKYTVSDIQGSDGIEFIFTKPMDLESVEEGITLIPNIEGVIEQMDKEGYEFAFIPDYNYKKNQQYEVKISKTIKDIYGLKLKENENLFFTPTIYYLKINEIKINSSDINPDIDSGKCCKFTPKKKELILNNVNEIYYSCSIMISFNTDFKNEDYKNVIDKIKMNLKFPLTASNPVFKHATWLTANRILLEYENLKPSSNEEPVFYELKISGGENGIKNHFSEYLEEDLCFYLEPISE